MNKKKNSILILEFTRVNQIEERRGNQAEK